MAGDTSVLSERELEVLKLVATGATNQEIARALVISPNTVKVHMRNIFEKLEVQSRTEATMEAVRRGWVSVPNAATAPAIEATSPPPVAPESPPAPRPALAPWQRVYMVLVGGLVLLASLAPAWWRARNQTTPSSAFSDVGQPQVAPELRPAVRRWGSAAPLPEPRSRLALAADGASLYAVGGETSSGVTNLLTIYSPGSNSWTAGPAKPTPVSNVGAAAIAGRLYVPGGSRADGGATDVLEVYDVRARTWEKRAPLPGPVAAYALAASGGKLYLFGGWDGAAYRADTLIYDPATDSWTVGSPLPSPRAFMAAGELKGLIYVVGGFDGKRELARVDVYDPAGEGAAGPWSSRAPLSQPRAGLGLAVLGSRLYAIGGGWTAQLAHNEQFDVPSGAWSRIETPVVGEWRNLGAAAQGQKVYAVGGWSGSYLASNEAYQALIRQLLPLGSTGG